MLSDKRQQCLNCCDLLTGITFQLPGFRPKCYICNGLKANIPRDRLYKETLTPLVAETYLKFLEVRSKK